MDTPMSKIARIGSVLSLLASAVLVLSSCAKEDTERLFTAKILTKASVDPVAITADSVTKTVASAKISGHGNDLVVDTSAFYKPTQSGAYPIMLATYEIVCSKYPIPRSARPSRRSGKPPTRPGRRV